jgi:DNA-nicking Smr family endonuclease
VRSLSPDESALWARVAATIRPLSRHVKSSPERGGGLPANGPVERSHSSATRVIHQSPDAPASRTPVKPRAHADRTLDGSWDKKLRSGSVDPDRTLDLHGLTLDGAWSAIDHGLYQAIARGDRVVLLITGHHRPGEPPVQRGKIRAAVHDWLAASRHSASIAAVRGAHRRHGGGGSLYIILKR